MLVALWSVSHSLLARPALLPLCLHFYYVKNKKCSHRDSNPSLSLERAWWLAGLHYGSISNYPPDETCNIVSSSSSFTSSSIGIGLFLFITINVSGFMLIFVKTSWILDPFSRSMVFISLFLDIFIVIFTWIDRDIKKGLIKLLTSFIRCRGSQARPKAVVSKTAGACTSGVQIPSPAYFSFKTFNLWFKLSQ